MMKLAPNFPSIKSNKAVWFSLLSVLIGFIATIFLISTFTTTDFTNNIKGTFPEPADYYVEEEQTKGAEVLEFGKNATHQTLNLLVGGARINNFNFEEIEIGKLEQAVAFQLLGDNSSNIYSESITIDGLIAPTLTISNGTAHNLIIKDNKADGNSFSSTLSNVADITFGSTRGSINIPYVSNSHFDMIIIDTTSSDSVCNSLTLTNISAFGGGVELSNFKTGTLTIINSRIGDGTGIDSPSFILEDSIEAGNLEISNNIEEPIYVN